MSPTEEVDYMSDEPDVERTNRKRELALGYRIFGALRWGDLGDGHITARDPERVDCFWVLRGDVSFDRATVDDLLLIGPDGDIVDSGGSAGSDLGSGRLSYNRTAFNIHWPIHEARPEVVGAAHTHTAWGTPYAAARRLLKPVSQEACVFHDDHSLFDDEEVQVLSLDGGKRIAEALGPNRAVILANHGFLTVGRSVGEAVSAFVTMDRVAEVHIKVPDAVPISDESAAIAKADLGPERSLNNGFRALVARHIGDASVVD